MSIEDLDKLSQVDRDQLLVELLQGLTWPVAPEVFAALCATFTTCGVDLAVLRKHPTTGDEEILLLQRPADDPFYPGQYHVPGSLFRGHEPIEAVIDRVLKVELPDSPVSPPVLIRGNYFRNLRGPDVMLLYATILKGEYAGAGEWFSCDHPPENMVEGHKVIPGQGQAWLRTQK